MQPFLNSKSERQNMTNGFITFNKAEITNRQSRTIELGNAVSWLLL